MQTDLTCCRIPSCIILRLSGSCEALKCFSCPLSPLLTCTFLHHYPTADLAFTHYQSYCEPTILPIVSIILTLSDYSSVVCFVFHLMVHSYYLYVQKGWTATAQTALVKLDPEPYKLLASTATAHLLLAICP